MGGKMSKPRIEIRYIEGGDMDLEDWGDLTVVVNGHRMDCIACDFDNGNDARLHMGLRRIVEAVYERGRNDGVEESRQRVKEWLDWVTGEVK
jgi:hypothetical protein